LIDATELPVERPKKAKTPLLQWQEKEVYYKDASGCKQTKSIGKLFVPVFLR